MYNEAKAAHPNLLLLEDAMKTKILRNTHRSRLPLLLILATLLFPALACNTEEAPPWTPETPRQYIAEVQTVSEVYVLLDSAGNVVDFGGTYSYGASAELRYQLRFWDVGSRKEGYGAAEIYKIYTPIRVTAIQQDLEEDLSAEQKADIYARTTFPSTEVKVAELEFNGGPTGNFLGTNLETGQEIYGYMEWRENEWEMHAVFTRDIKQDYLVLGDEPFYNWP
jgi:hypothetical protein